jgi:hypothetical protein
MDFKVWSRLSDDEQRRRCQSLNPYEDWPLFKSIEEAFVKEFGELPGVEKVFCGFGSGLGPYSAITVSIRKGAQRTKLPKYFMGFPVVREYASK